MVISRKGRVVLVVMLALAAVGCYGSTTPGPTPGSMDDVIAAAVEQERLEGWIMSQVAAGTPLPGLYPPNEETRARYEAWARTVR